MWPVWRRTDQTVDDVMGPETRPDTGGLVAHSSCGCMYSVHEWPTVRVRVALAEAEGASTQ